MRAERVVDWDRICFPGPVGRDRRQVLADRPAGDTGAVLRADGPGELTRDEPFTNRVGLGNLKLFWQSHRSGYQRVEVDFYSVRSGRRRVRHQLPTALVLNQVGELENHLL